MKKSFLFSFVFILSSVLVRAKSEKPVLNSENDHSSAPKGLYFKTYAGYLKYINIRAMKGVDSARAFYLQELLQTDDFVDGNFSGNVGIGTTSPSGRLGIMNYSTSVDRAMQLSQSGARTTASYGFILDNTSTSSTASIEKYGLWITSSGTWSGSGAANYGMRVTVSNGTNNYAAVFEGGNVGVGTVVPVAKLHIHDGTDVNGWFRNGSGSLGFQVISVKDDNSTYQNLSFDGAKLLLNSQTGGNVGIGTTSPSEKLSVNGNISAKKMIVTQTGWSDYVFDKEYKLRSLSSLEQYINQHKHLPEVPSAKEVKEKGISVGDNQALLLKKIEELTLYILMQEKRIIELEKKNKQ